MNFKTTIALVILAALAAGTFFYVRSQDTSNSTDSQTPDDKSGTPLFHEGDLSTSAASQIVVERDGKSLTLAKESGDWAQVKPVRFPVNNWSAEDVVNKAASLRYTEKLTPGVNDAPSLESLNLAPPLATVTIQTAGDKPATHIIKLGRKSIGGRGYAMIDDDKSVYVVDDGLHQQLLGGDTNEWRKKNLAAPGEAQVQRLTLARDGKTIEAIRGDTGWAFTGGASGRVDQDAVSALVGSVNGLWIGKFIADAPKDLTMYGLDQPSAVLTLVSAGPEVAPAASAPAATQPAKTQTHTLLIGAPADLKGDTFFAAWTADNEPPSVVFTVTKADAEKLHKSADDLRDPRLTRVKPADVREVSIDRPADKVAIKALRSAEGWSFADPSPGFKADSGQLSEFVTQVSQAKGDSFVPDVKPPADPVAVVKLTAIGRTEPDVLRVYEHNTPPASQPAATAPAETQPAEAKKQWLVVANNETTGYLVAADKLSRVFDPPIALRDRTVIDLQPEQIKTVVIQQPDGTKFTFTRNPPHTMTLTPEPPPSTQPATQPAAPAAWRLEGADKFESADFDRLLSDLLPLRATRWLTEPPATHGSAAVVTLIPTDARPVVLTLDQASRTAALAGADAHMFEVTPQLAAEVDGEYRDRTVLSVPAAAIDKIAVTRAGKTITITRGDAGKFVSPELPDLNQSVAAGLFDTLAGLRAQRFRQPEQVKLDLNHPDVTIQLTPQSGPPHTLSLWDPSHNDAQQHLARLDDGPRLYVLDELVAKKLTADPASKAEPHTPIGLPPGLMAPQQDE